MVPLFEMREEKEGEKRQEQSFMGGWTPEYETKQNRWATPTIVNLVKTDSKGAENGSPFTRT